MDIDYEKIANDIYQKWDYGSRFTSTYEMDIEGQKIEFSFELFELQGEEDPVYDINSPYFGPGGSYGLDAYIIETWGDCDDIDDEELSIAFTELINDNGDKDYLVEDYFEEK